MIKRYFISEDGTVVEAERLKAKQKENLDKKLTALAFNVALKAEKDGDKSKEAV